VISTTAQSSWAQAPADPTTQPGADAQAIREEVNRLRADFAALREQYDARLAALEARLAAVEGSAAAPAAAAPQAPPTEAQVPAGSAAAGGPTGALPVYGSPSLLSKIFNPDIAVIGNFLGTAGTNAIDPRPALEMEEAEASFQAIVDPYARADFFMAFGPEGVELEEGFVTFPTLPGGVLAKVGKLKAQFGKVNTFHAHQLAWADRPLVAVNLVGGEEGISDSGVSISRIVPAGNLFLEATGEIFNGDSEVFRSYDRDDVAWVGRLRGYGDFTESSNLELGASVAHGRNEVGPDASTTLFGADATFRWRPLQRAIYHRFLARTELVWSRADAEEGRATAFGWYAGGDYQFARRWFLGARYDFSERAFDPESHDPAARCS
jgi:hypothetical protein